MKQPLAVVLGVTIVTLVAAFSWAAQAPQPRLGVVLLHGKFAVPTDPENGLAAIGHWLEANDALTALPAMPWGKDWAQIGTGTEGSLAMLDDIVGSLRARGASGIVMVGHSLGANMGLAYAATRGGLAGLVMVAPGHRPEEVARRDQPTRDAVAEARRLVESGQGDTPFIGPDGVQGHLVRMTTTAATYLSWMDPQGLAAMEIQAPRLPASTPLLMVVGRRDPFYDDAEAAVYRPAARHSYSRYLPVGRGHSTTPMTGAAVIDNWIEGLPR